MKLLTTTILLALALALWAAPVFSHCEIPCGIYGDKMRFEMIEEHITTIEKSMKMIVELGGEGAMNDNQMVRWVNNKETHATRIQHIVNQYFMTQRIKPVDESEAEDHAKYSAHLEMLHHMLVYAMKCKQTTDAATVTRLRDVTASFRASYLGPEGEAHSH